MLISTEATGGQVVSTREEPRFYDDIGCLAADMAGSSGSDTHGRRTYVRTRAGAWIDAGSAAYARPPGANTPMGSGILAFETIEAARAAAPGANPLAWVEVIAQETREARR